MIIRYKLAEPVAYEVTTATGKKIVKKNPVQEVALAPGHDTDPRNDFKSFTARLKHRRDSAIEGNIKAAGESPMVIFRHPDHPHFVHVLHPSSKTPGHTQVTVFVRHEGKWTPHGDFQSSTRETAIRSMSGEHTKEHGLPYGSTDWKAAPFHPGTDKMEGLNEEGVFHDVSKKYVNHADTAGPEDDDDDEPVCHHENHDIWHGHAHASFEYCPTLNRIHVNTMKSHPKLGYGLDKVRDTHPEAAEINDPENKTSMALVGKRILKFAKEKKAHLTGTPVHDVTKKAKEKYFSKYTEGLDEAAVTHHMTTYMGDCPTAGDEGCHHESHFITHGHAEADITYCSSRNQVEVHSLMAHPALGYGRTSLPDDHPKAAEANHPDNKRSVALLGRHIMALAKSKGAAMRGTAVHPITARARTKYRNMYAKPDGMNEEAVKLDTINSTMLSHDNPDGSHCAHTKTRITHGNAFAVVFHHPCQKALHVDLMKAHKYIPLGKDSVAPDDPAAAEINHPDNHRSAGLVMRHIHKLAKHYGATIHADPMHPVTDKALRKYGVHPEYDEGVKIGGKSLDEKKTKRPEYAQRGMWQGAGTDQKSSPIPHPDNLSYTPRKPGKHPHEGESFYAKAKELGTQYHGGPQGIRKIDPAKLTTRYGDAFPTGGRHGRGFYTTSKIGTARWYNRMLTPSDPHIKKIKTVKTRNVWGGGSSEERVPHTTVSVFKPHPEAHVLKVPYAQEFNRLHNQRGRSMGEGHPAVEAIINHAKSNGLDANVTTRDKAVHLVHRFAHDHGYHAIQFKAEGSDAGAGDNSEETVWLHHAKLTPVPHRVARRMKLKRRDEAMKIKGFKPLREEAQPVFEELDHYGKRMVDGWKTPDHSHTDHIFGGPQRTHHTISIPLDHSSTPKEAPHEVVNHLASHGFEVHDYAKGLARKKGDPRPIRIGRVLERTKAPDHVKKSYTNDTSREAVKGSSEHHIVISRHPHMVAGMSTNQSWRSCMDIGGVDDYGKEDEDNDNLGRVQREHHAGTHVAYLAHKSDPEAKRPLARIALRQHTSNEGHKVLRPEAVHYGSAGPEFHDTLKKWSEHHMPYKQGQIYKKHENVYDDDGTANTHKFAGTEHPWLNHPDSDKREEAVKHVTDPSTLHRMAHDKNPYVRKEVAYNDHTGEATLHHLSGDHDHGVLEAVAEHPKLPSAVADKLAGHNHLRVKEAALRNRNTSSVALAKEVKTASVHSLRAIAKHRNTTPEIQHHIATTTDDAQSLWNVAYSEKTQAHTLHHLATETHPATRNYLAGAIAENTNTHGGTLHHIATHGEAEENEWQAVARHKNARPDTLHHIAKQPNSGYSHWGISLHPSASSETLHHLAQHSHDPSVHGNIINHPNVGDHTLTHMADPANGYSHKGTSVPGSSVTKPKETASYAHHTAIYAADALKKRQDSVRSRAVAAYKEMPAGHVAEGQQYPKKPTTIKKFKFVGDDKTAKKNGSMMGNTL
jgi:hypothetical protein